MQDDDLSVGLFPEALVTPPRLPAFIPKHRSDAGGLDVDHGDRALRIGAQQPVDLTAHRDGKLPPPSKSDYWGGSVLLECEECAFLLA